MTTTYQPRPGSKTAVAIDYLLANGGAATCADLSEAIDADRKDLPACFKAAIENRLLEPCDLLGRTGYRLVGVDAPGTLRASKTARLKITEAPDLKMIWPGPAQHQPKPGVGQNPGCERSVITSAEAPAVTAKATPRPKPERRETGPAPAPVAAGDVAHHDIIDHPPHYTRHPSGIECIEITEHMGFNLGNAIKYLWRADLKGAAIEDLKKAQWYIARELQKRTREGRAAPTRANGPSRQPATTNEST